MARAKYETKQCQCGHPVVIQWEYCCEARTGIATAFYNRDDFPGWPLPIDNCPGCGVELIADELENI